MFKKNIPLNIAGGSYQDRSRPLSSQQTKNLYPQVVEQGKENFVLHSFPGLKKMSGVTGKDRGMTVMGEVGYRVAGEALYRFDKTGSHTQVGTIEGEERCTFANDGINLIIVSEGKVYKHTGALTTRVLDSNIDGADSVTFINSQMVYGNNGLFVVSDAGIPDVASGLNAASAESQPDDLIRPYAFQQTVYMFGERSCEPWWNSGNGNPPLERIDGQIIEVGLGAKHSIAHTDEFLYWLGDDNAIYQASGGGKQRISSSAISHAISGYSDASSAYGYTFTFEGMNFYLITFPTDNKTWCLNESLGNKGWFEVSSGTNDGAYQGSSLVNVYGANWVCDASNGNLYILDIDTYTNNDETIQRRRITSSVNGKMLGAHGNRVQMSRIEFMMEQGVGLIEGQGEDPKIMVEISFDGGRSWNEKGFVRLGRLGDFTHRVELYALDSFYDAIFRITSSDAVPISIYSAAIDLRLAGR